MRLGLAAWHFGRSAAVNLEAQGSPLSHVGAGGGGAFLRCGHPCAFQCHSASATVSMPIQEHAAREIFWQELTYLRLATR